MKKQMRDTAPIQVSLKNHEKLRLLKMLLGKKKIDDVIGDMLDKALTVSEYQQTKTIEIRQ